MKKLKDEQFLQQEKERIEKMKFYENLAYQEGFRYLAGLDEVGRGPIAGPVVSAAVILPPDFFLAGVDDSKKVSPAKRLKLAAQIKKEAISWALGWVFPPYLDQINILNATRETMKLALAQLTPQPDYLLIDALKLSDITIRQCSLIKGDSLSVSIASASILAKVERDLAMEAYDLLYPGYGLAKHKGYATREHIQALWQLGATEIHRISFEPVKSMLSGGKYGEQPGLFEQSDAEYTYIQRSGTESGQR
ncbi:MAG: ribonuclease HII [Syntrophomonadaceae bacterium]|nr:ribonuclease HII [Syntrophomonadaceae bacterium]